MPSFTIELNNSTSSLCLTKDAEQWALFFDGEIEREVSHHSFHKFFHILVKGQEVLDGYNLQARVIIDPSLHQGEDAERTDIELGIGKPGHIHFGYLAPEPPGTPTTSQRLHPEQHYGDFEVYVRLPPDEIHRLRQIDLSIHQMFLRVLTPYNLSRDYKQTDAIYWDGNDPDGSDRELFWDTDRAFYSPVEKFNFVITPVQHSSSKEAELSSGQRLPNEAQTELQRKSDRSGKDSSSLGRVVD